MVFIKKWFQLRNEKTTLLLECRYQRMDWKERTTNKKLFWRYVSRRDVLDLLSELPVLTTNQENTTLVSTPIQNPLIV